MIEIGFLSELLGFPRVKKMEMRAGPQEEAPHVPNER